MTKLKEKIEQIKTVFEKINYNKSAIEKRENIITSNVYNLSNELFGLSNKYSYFKSFAATLRISIKGIIDFDCSEFSDLDIEKILMKKIRKVFLTFFSINFIFNYFEKINKKFFKEEGFKKQNEKLMLLVGMVDIENDETQVYKELKMILETAQNTDYFVYPLIACKQKYFEDILKKFHFDIVHISGHTTETNMLLFNDEKISGVKFSEFFSRNKVQNNLIILNCCNSDLYYHTCTLTANSVITYDQLLYNPIPYDFSENFYSFLMLRDYDFYTSYEKSNIDKHYVYYGL